MVKKSWKDEKYYQMACLGSLDVKHPGMVILKSLVKKSENILDLGCGEGTRLAYLVDKKTKGVGVDISKKAIKLAKSNYPGLKFVCKDMASIPFPDSVFELVYCAYALEHIKEPEKVINEAIRVTKEGGNLVFIAPNYGSPNRASPPYVGSRAKKMFVGIYKDLKGLYKSNLSLNWQEVKPIKSGLYKQDFDTIVEPYARSLISYLGTRKMKVFKRCLCWSYELKNAKLHQKIIRFLAGLNMYPFVYWGPHFVVAAKKYI